MRRDRFQQLASIFLTLGIAAAADVYGPVMGIVADPSGQTIRPLRGMPGGATVAGPIDLGGASVVALWPRQNRAIVSSASGLSIATVASDGTVSRADTGAAPDFQPTIVAFSPSGSLAALYDSTANAMVFAGNAPVLPSTLPAAVKALAISDGAAPLIAGALADGAGSIFVADGQGHAQTLSGFRDVSALAFVGATTDLAIADQRARRVLLIHDPLSGNAPQILFSVPAISQGPIQIASSADGVVLAVLAGAGSSESSGAPQRGIAAHGPERRATLGLLRIADQQWTEVDCNCTPQKLAPLRGNAVFRLTDAVDQPVWILDGDSSPARISFVPAVQP